MFKKLLESGPALLLRNARGTEWGQLADYLSPSFFDVMPARQLLSQGRELLRNSSDGAGFAAARAEVEGRLRARGLPLDIVARDALPEAGEMGDESARRALGTCALEIYFGQLASADVALLDLRKGRLVSDGDTPPGYLWGPGTLWLRWDADFLPAVRELYLGFYRDDDALFQAGVAKLGLQPAADVLKKHFGEGDQTAVRFRTDVFHSTFHEVFVRCRDEGRALHRNFLALGVYLACLYDGLEALDVSFDVRGAFERVQDGAPAGGARGVGS